jgi:tRNA U34 5-carboxymethylaminomethyl modifying GTPase MnmE/TrmE
MVRQIKLEQIDDLMKEAVQELVQKTTLQWTTLAKKATPVGETGNLRNGWKTNIGKLRGTIINNIEYAEPVIYGTSLPPSWKGRYRTRKQTIKGFPELQAKQLTVGYIPKELKRIIRRS